MLISVRHYFLHRLKATVMLIAALLFVLNTTYLQAQTSKKNTKADKQKNAVSDVDLSKVEWPEYFFSYAQGGDFRKEHSLSPEEKYMAPYILSIPLIITPQNNQREMMDLWKKAIYASFSSKEATMQKMQAVAEENSAPELVIHNDPYNSVSVSGKAAHKPGFELPEWVRPYTENEEVLERLFNFQYILGNVIYCSEDIKFPLLIDTSATTVEDKLLEADKYYNAVYWWSAAYPELFYAIDDVNLKSALESKNKELVYHYGRYRFALDTASKGKMAKEKKSSNKIVQP